MRGPCLWISVYTCVYVCSCVVCVLKCAWPQAGFQVTSAVSGVTNYLVYGSKLEDGREVTTGAEDRETHTHMKSAHTHTPTQTHTHMWMPTPAGTKYKKAQELAASGRSKVGIEVLSEHDFVQKFANLFDQPKEAQISVRLQTHTL